MTQIKLGSVRSTTFKSALGAVVLCGAILSAIGSAGCSLSGEADDNKRRLPDISKAPVFDVGLSVEDAYAAIPHRRTVLDPESSDIPKADKDYLRIAFHVIDQGVLLRVSTFRDFSRRRNDDRAIGRMRELIEFFEKIDPPDRLKDYHKKVKQALTEETEFFAEWSKQGDDFRYRQANRLPSHPSVQRASAALREAYQILMRAYPQESLHNKTAFFDYHCALDFL